MSEWITDHSASSSSALTAAVTSQALLLLALWSGIQVALP